MIQKILSVWKICLLFLGLLIGVFSSVQAQVETSVYATGSIPVIDGDLGDWEGEFIKAKKENWYYLLTYDEEAIYVGMAFLDPDLQHQILMCGLTCWIETKETKKSPQGIRYPTGLPKKQRPSDSESLAWYLHELSSTKRLMIKEQIGLELVNMEGNNEVKWGRNVRENGLSAQLGLNAEGDVLYELKIPRAAFPELWADSEEKNPTFSLTWETGSLGRPKDLSGRDVIGITGGNTSNATLVEGQSVRMLHARQDQYRSYASPRKLKLKKLSLEN